MNKINKFATKKLQDLVFPTKRQENWRYSDMNLLNSDISAEETSEDLVCAEDRLYACCFYDSETFTSNVPGLDIYSSDEVYDVPEEFLQKYQVMHNHANIKKVLYLNFTKTLKEPVFLKFLLEEKEVNIALIVNVKKNVQLRIFEEYISKFFGYLNIVIYFVLGEGSKVINIKTNKSLGKFLYTSHIKCSVGSVYKKHTMNANTVSYREEISSFVQEKGHCGFYGAVFGEKNQFYDSILESRIDNHAYVEQKYNQIVGGISHASFYGKVKIESDRVEAKCVQENKNILLSDKAKIFSRPELDIFSENVMCKHGATIGQIDENIIFYIKSRGISENLAKKLFIESFLVAVFENKDINPNDIFYIKKRIMDLPI